MSENPTETPPEATPPVAPPPPAAPSPEAIELQAARDELAGQATELAILKKQVEELAAELATAQTEDAAKARTLGELWKQIGELSAQLKAATGDLEAKAGTIAELRKQIDELAAQLKTAQADIEGKTRATADLQDKHDELAARLAVAPLGYCPICGKPGHTRTGDVDRCHSGHDYPSVTALHAPLAAWNPGLPTTDTALRIENERLRKEVADLVTGATLQDLRTQLAAKDRDLTTTRQEAERATSAAARLKTQLVEHMTEIRRLKGEPPLKPAIKEGSPS